MYQKLNLIGRGANGDVYLGKNLQKETYHVIKTLKMRDINQKQRETIETELKLLQEFKHPNIVPFHDSFIDTEGSLNIVMAYCEGGDIHNLIENAEGKKFGEKQILDWVVQLALSIFYMHERRVLHRDIKTQNIFLTSGRVMLGDFGVSKVLDKAADLARTNIGTPYYMSPEQYRNKPYSYKSDIWAFGCIIYEMCNHKHVFQALSLQALAVKVTRGAYSPVSECYSQNLRSLVDQMLNQNPKNRPSILQILKKPFLFRRAQQYMKEVYTNRIHYEPQQIQSLKAQAKTLGFSLDQEPRKPVNKTQKTPSKSNTKADKRNERSQQKAKQQRQKRYQQLRKKLRDQMEERTKAEKKLKEVQKMKKERKGSEKNLHSNYGSVKSRRESIKTEQSTVTVKTPVHSSREYGVKSKPKLQQIDYQSKKSVPKLSAEPTKEQPSITEASKEEIKQVKVEAKSEFQQKIQKFQMKEEYDMDYEQYEQEKEQLNEINEDDEEQSDREQEASQKPQKTEKLSQQQQQQEAPEQSIHQLKEEVKEKTIIISNIRNQMTKLDFVISSDSQADQEKGFNPAYTRLTEKINDLKQKIITQLGRQGYSSFLNYMIANQQHINRSEVNKLIGDQNVGMWHIADNIIKLDRVLAKIPKYVQ